MRRSTRRDFIQASSALALGVALHPRLRLSRIGDALARAGASERVHARPVPLDRVRLTGGPLKRAQDADIGYLMSLEPDRMMALYRMRANLEPKGGAQPYGGWDGPGRNLTGHVTGHHLSAVSLMYAATGDARFRERADYLVSELKAVQDAHGDGYLSALDGLRVAFAELSRGEIRSAPFDLNGIWSPWYTLHKTFAGLRDAYRYTGNPTALQVETAFAGWAERVLAPLNEAQLARMLNTEFGGMNEVLADLAVDTNDDRWRVLSYKFEHHALTDALERYEDVLAGKHANCQIPKLIGSAARYEYAGDPADLVAAAFFWDRVARHNSYASGGDGLNEYFGFPDQLSHRIDGRACESCCVYNMLKLTRRLFSFRPDAEYADFHERALFNHALASFDPDGMRMSYMVPVGRVEQQEYQDMQHDFTCCVGTGMENHALHGLGIYYEAADTVWVNLFAPSTAQLANGVGLSMDTGFPDGDAATLTITGTQAQSFTLAVRRPSWAGDGFALRVNGEAIGVPSLDSQRVGAAGGRVVSLDGAAPPSSYVRVTREWRPGDVVQVSLPKSLRLDPTPDDPTVAAIMWGPLVLAADLGARRDGLGDSGGDGAGEVGGAGSEQTRVNAPVLVTANRLPSAWTSPGSRAGDFTVHGVARSLRPDSASGDVSLTPFYRTHGRTYGVYLDVLTPAQFDARVKRDAAERAQQQRLEAATLAFLKPGDARDEQRFAYHSEPADRPVVRNSGRVARGGAGWFSFDIPVATSAPLALVVTHLNDLSLPVYADFAVSVNGTVVGRYSPNATASAVWDAEYDVPAALTRSKRTITVRFEAGDTSRIVPVYGIRVVRASATHQVTP